MTQTADDKTVEQVASSDRLLQLRRCRSCGHRVPDPQTTTCGECGFDLALQQEGIFLRGTARGWLSNFGTSSASSIGFALFPLIAVSMFMLQFLKTGALMAICYAAVFGILIGWMLLKRLVSPPDSLVVAYLGPGGFGQDDALPRWPVVDTAVIVLAQGIVGVGFISVGGMEQDFVEIALLSLLFLFAIGLTATFVFRRARQDPVETAMRRRVSWDRAPKPVIKPAGEGRSVLHVDGGWSGGVHIEFDCNASDADALAACLNAWRDTAIANEPRKESVFTRVRRLLSSGVRTRAASERVLRRLLNDPSR